MKHGVIAAVINGALVITSHVIAFVALVMGTSTTASSSSVTPQNPI